MFAFLIDKIVISYFIFIYYISYNNIINFFLFELLPFIYFKLFSLYYLSDYFLSLAVIICDDKKPIFMNFNFVKG